VAVISGGLGRVLRQRFEVGAERAELADRLATVTPSRAAPALPADAELGVEGIQRFVVPNDEFYRIDTALVVPQVSAESWKLSIGGMVDRPLELTFDDLLARPQVERYITLSCVSNEVGGRLVGNALWQGVLLKDVLDEAGVEEGAEQIVSRSVDGWTCGTPTEVVMDGRDAMLAIAMNGEPLPARHGYPVRMVVPGLFGYVSATKWVTDIRLTRWEDFDAYWVPRGWAKRGPVKTMARIDTPRTGRSAEGVVPIGGVAWAVHRGVSAVQIRIDEGEWRDADLGGVPSADTWVQWVYRLDSSELTSGRHGVEVRAIDGDGVPQPEEPKPVAPDGAQGYHRITIDV
jgi:DMSO/TMAO reductase YedYZ molybdopterin-dependent catalytic subunit